MKWWTIAAMPLALLAAVAAIFWPGAPAVHAQAPRNGVAVDIVFGTPAEDELRDVDEAAQLGADVIRVAVHWSGLEPLQKGQYAAWYLERLDGLVARARERGVKVLLTPLFTPCWAARGVAADAHPCADRARLASLSIKPPERVQDYADVAAFLAARYGDALAGIEVWNEPNHPSFFESADPAADYAALLAATHRAVKAASPATRIVAGAVAGADTGFLQRLYDAGIQGHYDVLSLHIYNDGRAPEELIDARYAASTFLQGLRAARATTQANDDSHPVWLTELGWNTSTQRGALWSDGVTPQQQADYLGRALAMLRDPSSGIGFPSAVFVYRLRDTGADASDPQQNYGLESVDRVRKPAFDVVRRAFGAEGDPSAPATTVTEPAAATPPAAAAPPALPAAATPVPPARSTTTAARRPAPRSGARRTRATSRARARHRAATRRTSARAAARRAPHVRHGRRP